MNENLVEGLIIRDELCRNQDALLTDVEDITKGIGAGSSGGDMGFSGGAATGDDI